MGLVELARRWIDPRSGISVETFRQGRPLRNPVVVASPGEGGTVHLVAPLAGQGRGYAAWLAKRMGAPATKTFELEPVGAFVWARCDGGHTFDRISAALRSEYKMNRAEADAALAAFLQTLGRRGLIVMTTNQP